MKLLFDAGQSLLTFGEAIEFDSATPRAFSVLTPTSAIGEFASVAGKNRSSRLVSSQNADSIMDNFLGRSVALDELTIGRSPLKSSSECVSWDGDTCRLANTIRSYRTSIQQTLNERSRIEELERQGQLLKIQKLRAYRDKVANSSTSRKWIQKAENEIRMLQTVDREVEEDLRRERAKALRESERIVACLAPNGLNLRGKSQRGAFIGLGPVPCAKVNEIHGLKFSVPIFLGCIKEGWNHSSFAGKL